MMPPAFERDGELFDRVTIDFAAGRNAAHAGTLVHDALIRAHGYRMARRFTKALAVAGGRFPVAIARRAVKALKRRLRLIDRTGLIDLYVAGRRMRAVD
jgi:hypothetical protein